jgi:tellurite methyltransferase
MAHNINNHLRNGYSEYNLMFLKKYHKELNLKNKVLDVGCGHYRNLKLFYELGFRDFTGIDKNTPEPIITNKNFKVKFILADIEKRLPFEDERFDIVICNYVLMFIEPNRLNFVLEELLRVAKGFLLIETNNPKNKGNRSEFKSYKFESIVDHVKAKKDFEIMDLKMYYEKLIIRRC